MRTSAITTKKCQILFTIILMVIVATSRADPQKSDEIDANSIHEVPQFLHFLYANVNGEAEFVDLTNGEQFHKPVQTKPADQPPLEYSLVRAKAAVNAVDVEMEALILGTNPDGDVRNLVVVDLDIFSKEQSLYLIEIEANATFVMSTSLFHSVSYQGLGWQTNPLPINCGPPEFFFENGYGAAWCQSAGVKPFANRISTKTVGTLENDITVYGGQVYYRISEPGLLTAYAEMNQNTQEVTTVQSKGATCIKVFDYPNSFLIPKPLVSTPTSGGGICGGPTRPLGPPMLGFPVTYGDLSLDNRSADIEPGEPQHAGQPGGNSLWLSFDSISHGTLVLDTEESSVDTLLAAYIGDEIDDLLVIQSNDDFNGMTSSQIEINTEPGELYRIAVDSKTPGDVFVNFYFVADFDLDGVPDPLDNCTEVNNATQRDTNGDGYGNFCDPDLNNDGTVNFTDVALWIPHFGTTNNGDEDFNGDGLVNFSDYAILIGYFLEPPGPSGVMGNP